MGDPPENSAPFIGQNIQIKPELNFTSGEDYLSRSHILPVSKRFTGLSSGCEISQNALSIDGKTKRKITF